MDNLWHYDCTDDYDRLMQSIGYRIDSFVHLGEFISKARDTNDEELLLHVAEEIRDRYPQEALVIALECGDYDLAEDLKDELGLDDPDTEKYLDLIRLFCYTLFY